MSDPIRICVALEWREPSWSSRGEVVLMAKWMTFYLDASGSMVPGKVSNWEAVSGDTDTVVYRVI
jgi:hypothetical protein